jgi:hypothetical protein
MMDKRKGEERINEWIQRQTRGVERIGAQINHLEMESR